MTRSAQWVALSAAVALNTAGPATAQDTDLRIEQVPGAGPHTPAATEQLSASGEGRPATVQVATQVATGPATAAAPPPLSHPAQSRPEGVQELGGIDRCDNGRDTTGDATSDSAVCRNPIESRAAQFGRRVPAALSPEQRLLAQQQLSDQPLGDRAIVRRLGRGDDDADQRENQEVASLVLSPSEDAPSTRSSTPAVDLPTDAQALVEALRSIAASAGSPQN